jgi:putative transposase
MGPPAKKVTVSTAQRRILERLVRSSTAPQRLVLRAQIVLKSADGLRNLPQAHALGVDRQRVRRWRARWCSVEARLSQAEVEGASEKELTELINEVLSDEYRSGVTPKFSAEQVTQILAVACERPDESGYPVSHWTPKELATELIKRKIVSSISPRHVDRFLKGGRYTTAQGRVLDEAQGRRPRALSPAGRARVRPVSTGSSAR